MVETQDPVADATRIMRDQNAEIHRLRVELIKSRCLLREGLVYVRITEKRWADICKSGEPATSVRIDIEKFLEEK